METQLGVVIGSRGYDSSNRIRRHNKHVPVVVVYTECTRLVHTPFIKVSNLSQTEMRYYVTCVIEKAWPQSTMNFYLLVINLQQ